MEYEQRQPSDPSSGESEQASYLRNCLRACMSAVSLVTLVSYVSRRNGGDGRNEMRWDDTPSVQKVSADKHVTFRDDL